MKKNDIKKNNTEISAIIITIVSIISGVLSVLGLIYQNQIPAPLYIISPYIVVISILAPLIAWCFNSLNKMLCKKYDSYTITTNEKYEKDVQRIEQCVNEDRLKYQESVSTYRNGIISTLIKQADSLREIDYDFREYILTRLAKYLSEKSTGALENSDYYAQLTKFAKLIMEEKAQKKNFSGKIWAQSSLLEEEWVNEGGEEISSYEKSWIDCMKKIDDSGIKTSRLYIFSDKFINLLQENAEPPSNKVTELLSKLKPYLESGSYKNTTSFAITHKQYKTNNTAQKLLGAGYFALTFSDGRSIMIRDADPYKKELSKLEGSVDYCQDRLKEAFACRQQILEQLACPLNDFLDRICSERIKNYIKSSVSLKE